MSEERKYVSLILSEKAYTLLQTTLEKGDLNELFQKAIANADWENVNLFKRRKTPPLVKQTQIMIDATIYKVIIDQAQKTQMNFDALLDVILTSYSQMIEEKWKSVSILLSEKADSLLRTTLRRRGDLSKLFNEAMTNTNWDEVEVVSRRKTYQVFKKTTISISPELYEQIRHCAQQRQVELTALIDAIIIACYSREKHNA